MCIFGHKLGEVKPDGFQYCSRCGEAKKPSIPHPCVNGHMWEDQYEQQYTHTRSGMYGGKQEYTSMEYFQKCNVCGHKRSIKI
jgi:hypothetical protein